LPFSGLTLLVSALYYIIFSYLTSSLYSYKHFFVPFFDRHPHWGRTYSYNVELTFSSHLFYIIFNYVKMG